MNVSLRINEMLEFEKFRSSILGLTCIVLSLSGCQADSPAVIRNPKNPQPNVDLTHARRGPAVGAQFNATLTAQGQVRFLSFNGKWQGNGADFELLFLPGTKVRLTRYAQPIQQYDGTYDLDTSGSAVVAFQTLPWRWPAMTLLLDDKTLILTLSKAKDADNWPFRALPK